MKLFKRLNQNEHGTIILVFIITLPFLITIALYYTTLSLTSLQVARFDQFHTMAQLAADAGADASVEAFNVDNTWTNSGGDVTVHSDSKIKTTYSSSLSGSGTSRVLLVTGKTYFPATATSPNRTVKIAVDLRSVSSGTYSIVSGSGGLTMINSSKVVGGDVSINGSITMSNNSQIGLSTNPVNVKVADQICPIPADSTYPQVCSGTSHPPITINNPAHIYGTVTATNQTDGTGMSSPGLVSGTTPVQALPTYDRASQKAAVVNNMTGAAASCSGNTTITWPANTKITGDVSVSQKCNVIVKGNVWITGSLTITNNQSALVVDDSLGATRPVIMIDSQTGLNITNSAGLTANSSGTGFEIIDFYGGGACSPDCSSVTGTALTTSRVIPTINVNTSGDASNSIFYAYWTEVNLQNSGQIGAIIGQTLNLSNNSTITFGSNVSTGHVTWVVKGYRRQ